MRFSWDDYEPETTFTLPALPGEPDLTIQIAKVGGGTVGRAYTGYWQAVVTCADQEVYRTDQLHTTQACTHHDAARHLVGFISGGTGADPALARRLSTWFFDGLCES